MFQKLDEDLFLKLDHLRDTLSEIYHCFLLVVRLRINLWSAMTLLNCLLIVCYTTFDWSY